MSEPISVKITGLTNRQRLIADLLWSCDSKEEREFAISNMPKSFLQEIPVVESIVLATCIDALTENNTEFPVVKKYLESVWD